MNSSKSANLFLALSSMESCQVKQWSCNFQLCDFWKLSFSGSLRESHIKLCAVLASWGARPTLHIHMARPGITECPLVVTWAKDIDPDYCCCMATDPESPSVAAWYQTSPRPQVASQASRQSGCSSPASHLQSCLSSQCSSCSAFLSFPLFYHTLAHHNGACPALSSSRWGLSTV